MPYYEVIYEPGTKSICNYESDEEAMTALTAHMERATSGQPATPESSPHPSEDAPASVGTWAAERPVKVYVYDSHPADYEPQVNPSDLSGSNEEMLQQLRSAVNPLNESPGVQDSQYKMEPSRELDISSLSS